MRFYLLAAFIVGGLDGRTTFALQGLPLTYPNPDTFFLAISWPDNSSRLPHWIRIKPVNTQTFILLPFTLNTVYSTLSDVPVCEASQFQLEEIFKDSSSNSYFAIK